MLRTPRQVTILNAQLQGDAKEVIADCRAGTIEKEDIWVSNGSERGHLECCSVPGSPGSVAVQGIGAFASSVFNPPDEIKLVDSGIVFKLPSQVWEAKGSAVCASVSRNGDLAVGGRDGQLWIYSAAGPVHKVDDAHFVSTTAVCWHPSKPVVYSSGLDRMLKEWSSNNDGTMTLRTSRQLGKDKITAMEAVNSSLYLAGESQVLKRYNTETGDIVDLLTAAGSIRSLSVCEDLLCLADSAGVVACYDLDGKSLGFAATAPAIAVACSTEFIAFSINGGVHIVDRRRLHPGQSQKDATVLVIASSATQLRLVGKTLWGLQSEQGLIWGYLLSEPAAAETAEPAAVYYAVSLLKPGVIASSKDNLYVAGQEDCRKYEGCGSR